MRAAASPIALILPGGAALGAYEAGVVDYILRDVADAIGAAVAPDVLCGTSVGALAATLLAASADEPRLGAESLVAHWRSLRLEHLLRLEVLRTIANWVSGCATHHRQRVGGILNVRHLEQHVRDVVPFARIDDNLRCGRLRALTVSTTHVASGNTVVFVQTRAPLFDWTGEQGLVGRRATIAPEHLMASAAIPLLFPAVRIDGDLYCEGGLRQNVPLAPALHLGADRLVVVSPHHVADPDRALGRARERAMSGPLFLLGRMLNALLLDRIDADVERLAQINAVVEAGERAFGSRFVESLERERRASTPFRLVDSTLVRASQSIGLLAGQFVRSRRFDGRGLRGTFLRQIAEAEGTAEADLVAYFLFDGAFASELIALGRQDARRQHDRLCTMLAPRPARLAQTR
jgi:NTE family protein